MDGKAEPEPEPEHGVSFGAGARMSAVLVAAGRSSVHGGDGGPRPGVAAKQMSPTQLEAARATVALEPGAHLGSGSFADVYRGQYQFKGRREPVPVAFKVFRGGKLIPLALRAQTRTEAAVRHRLD